MMNNENGRSMVEMLGVLAIIGVLSVAGIAGYTMAMNKYKANEILNLASQAVILARSYNVDGYTDSSYTNVTNVGIEGTAIQSYMGTPQIKYASNKYTVKFASGDACNIAKDNANSNLFDIACS